MTWFGMSACSITALCVFGQIADPLSGGSGWIGAGLLGAVLSWLLFVHLPAKDKQADAKDEKIRAIIHEHTETEKDQRHVHSALEREQRADFAKTIEAVLEHSRKQTVELANALREDLDTQRQGLEALRGAVESLAGALRGLK